MLWGADKMDKIIKINWNSKQIISILLGVIMILTLFQISHESTFGQSVPTPPPIKNYQDYLIMMRALNEVQKAHGMKPEKPLTEKEWKKVYVGSKGDIHRDQNLDQNSKSSQKDEKTKLLNSDFGDFRKAKRIKKSGKTELKVWDRYVENMKNFSVRFGKGDYGQKEVDGVMSLNVDYDEIWVGQRTEYLTASEIKKSKGKLDLFKLYWLKGKVQAFTAESFFEGDPTTGSRISKPEHKIRLIYNREYILKELSK